ncbi:MAG: hypothetical protein R2684_12775 [Pyrinomonadaceae bacterium]
MSCHRKQFFGTPKPQICSICHTNPGPRNSTRRKFPNPATRSDFAVSFPHDKHADFISSAEPKKKSGDVMFAKVAFSRKPVFEEGCATCHQTYKPQGESEDEYFTVPPKDLGDAYWLKKGTFKTQPSDHTSCFTCHNQEMGISPAPSSCATCHKLKGRAPASDFDAKAATAMKIRDGFVLSTWKKRTASATFRHEWMSHAEMDCSTCHDISADAAKLGGPGKVSIATCSMCHATPTSDDGGILNYEIDSKKADAKFACVKCHLEYGHKAIPASHTEAIEAQAGP